jgi:hypothetical protein
MTIIYILIFASIIFVIYRFVVSEIKQTRRDHEDSKEFNTKVGRNNSGGIFYYDCRDEKAAAKDVGF